MICLPLVAEEKSDLLKQAGELMLLAPDLLEWRIDGYSGADDVAGSLETLKALRAVVKTLPLLFTCRIEAEGGLRRISRGTRLDLIAAAIQAGLVDMVDIELCNDREFIDSIIETATHHGVRTILSFHDFERTPDESDIVDKLVQAQALGADIAKAAVMPQDYADVLVLLNATLKARTEAVDIPIITISMADEGKISRIAGGLFGSDITFAAGKTTSAPGQIPIEDLRQAMAALY